MAEAAKTNTYNVCVSSRETSLLLCMWPSGYRLVPLFDALAKSKLFLAHSLFDSDPRK